MKIVSQNDTRHIIKLIPRFYPLGAMSLELTNEASNTKTTLPIVLEGFSFTNNYNIIDGYLNLTFDFTFLNKDRYSFKLTDEIGVVYRGKIYATREETQNYKQTADRYEY